MRALIPASDFLPPQETWCKHLRSHCLEPLWFYYEMAWIKEAIKLAKKDSELCSINHEKGHFMSTIIISRMGCSSLRNLFPSCSINLDFYLLPLSSPEAGPGDTRTANITVCYLLTLVEILLAKATATESFHRCCLGRIAGLLIHFLNNTLNEEWWDLIKV